MSEPISQAWVVVDIGNTSMKFGLSSPPASGTLRAIDRTLRVETIAGDLDALRAMLPPAPCRWIVASVNRLGTKRLKEWITQHRTGDEAGWITNSEVPIRTDVDAPERVGIDRLLAAYAVNSLRDPSRAAIIISSGTAITVDLVSAEGVFRGGAIFPGLELMARALHDRTDALPLVEAGERAPPLPGKNTTAALQGALYWGIRGAVAAIVDRLQAQAGGPAELFITNLDSSYLSEPAREERFLVLRGLLAIAGNSSRG